MAHNAPLQKPSPSLCFYVRPSHAYTEYYRAIYLKERTMRALINGISEKLNVGLASVGRITYHDSKSMQVMVNEDVLDKVEDGQHMSVELLSTKHSRQSPLVDPSTTVFDNSISLSAPPSSLSASYQSGEDVQLDNFDGFVALLTREDATEDYSEYTSLRTCTAAKEINLVNSPFHDAGAPISSPQNVRTAISLRPPIPESSPPLLEGIDGFMRRASESPVKSKSKEARTQVLGALAGAAGNLVTSYRQPKKPESCLIPSSLKINTRFLPQSGKSPTAASMADLDRYVFPQAYCYAGSFHSMDCDQDDFGFDPPTSISAHSTFDVSCRSNDHNDTGIASAWLNFEAERESKRHAYTESGTHVCPLPVSRTVDNIQTKAPSSGSSTFSGFVPDASPSSASSIELVAKEPDFYFSTKASMRKNKSKVQIKEPKPAFPATRSPPKRKNLRKSTASVAELTGVAEDKRRKSLEKNREAAAKCRANKKEKTERMQNDSRKNGVRNASLKDTTERLRQEIEYMNNLLLVHLDCEDCDKPEEVKNYFRKMGSKYLSNPGGQRHDSTHRALSEPIQQLDLEQLHLDCFTDASSTQDQAMFGHPRLSEQNESSEFDMESLISFSSP